MSALLLQTGDTFLIQSGDTLLLQLSDPSGFKPYWARNVNTLIGGGV